VRRRPGSERRGLLALGLLLALAAALRIAGIRYGLPFPFLNPDEASIVPRAWRIAHGGGLDPGWYDYPSLAIYLLAPVQAFFDEPSYLAGRLVVAALGVACVGAAWWLGQLAYGRSGALSAAAATAVASTHVAYSHVAVTDIPLVLGVTAALALALSGRLEWAGLVAGLAASAKYPALLLAVPLLVAGWGAWRRLARAGALAVAGFALTSPFVLVHPAEAWDDASRVQRLARAGWLGFEDDGPAALAFLDRAWDALGPALVVALAGLVVALLRRARADLVLASFVLAYYASLLTIDAHFDRYVLPLLAPLGALAGRNRAFAAVTLALLVVPLAWSIGDDRRLLREDTRIEAHAWLEENLPRGARVAADPSTPPLEGRRVLRLELPGPGREPDPNRDVDRLRAQGIEYVVVTGAVADRVLAAAPHYPREARFYRELDTRGRLFYTTSPELGRTGPWVRVYALR
jgi:4-amino-4-deoxy-L-arabinose transferase-like glycosyltransferase